MQVKDWKHTISWQHGSYWPNPPSTTMKTLSQSPFLHCHFWINSGSLPCSSRKLCKEQTFSYSLGVCMWSLVLTTQTNFECGGIHPCSATIYQSIYLSIIYQSSIYLLSSSSGVFICASFTFGGVYTFCSNFSTFKISIKRPLSFLHIDLEFRPLFLLLKTFFISFITNYYHWQWLSPEPNSDRLLWAWLSPIFDMFSRFWFSKNPV